MSDGGWLSADECDEIFPDHDYPSTVDNLENAYGISTDLKCWALEDVATSRIDPFQLIDDLDDDDGHAKVESIRQTLRSEAFTPPVILIHRPSEGVHPYVLIEGRHRYNATHGEGVSRINAWVAHVGCCGGPSVNP